MAQNAFRRRNRYTEDADPNFGEGQRAVLPASLPNLSGVQMKTTADPGLVGGVIRSVLGAYTAGIVGGNTSKGAAANAGGPGDANPAITVGGSGPSTASPVQSSVEGGPSFRPDKTEGSSVNDASSMRIGDLQRDAHSGGDTDNSTSERLGSLQNQFHETGYIPTPMKKKPTALSSGIARIFGR